MPQYTQLSLPIGKKIHTLTGEVPVNRLGKTLMHEHVFCKVRTSNLHVVEDYLASQLKRLKASGIDTIVDLTTYVLPDRFYPIISRYEVNVICCAGYYLKSKVPKSYHQMGELQLTKVLEKKFVQGLGKYKVKPNIIKVASSGNILNDFETRIISAAATVHKSLNVPIATHAQLGGRKQLELLLRLGTEPSSVFISHLEMGLKGTNKLTYREVCQDAIWILQQGAYLFFGDFTVNDSPYRRKVIQLLQHCCSRGFENQIFLSADSYWSYRRGEIRVRGSSLQASKPRTYEYTQNHIVPLLTTNGFSTITLNKFIRQNPIRFFNC